MSFGNVLFLMTLNYVTTTSTFSRFDFWTDLYVFDPERLLEVISAADISPSVAFESTQLSSLDSMSYSIMCLAHQEFKGVPHTQQNADTQVLEGLNGLPRAYYVPGT